MIDIEVLRKVQKSLSRYIFAKEYLSWNGIRKACNNIILSIPAELADPVMIFKSRTRDDSFVFFTEQKDENDRTVLIPLAVNKKKGRIYINEVTSMYGRNKIDIMKKWVEKGWLLYVNDLDIEKAPTNVGTLYMRVIHNASAYINNIIKKSDIVNNTGIMYMKENNNTYGFVHNNKIYLNPEFMNSNAAVHEYTHLWDAYTQKTGVSPSESGR